MSDIAPSGSVKAVLRTIEAFLTERNNLDDAARLDKIHAYVKTELGRLSSGQDTSEPDLETPEGFRRVLEGEPL